MADTAVRGVIPYVFCADAGAVADWCVEVLGFTERQRWADADGRWGAAHRPGPAPAHPPQTRSRSAQFNGDRYRWSHDASAIEWEELSELYRIAPLGHKPPEALEIVFVNSMFSCFVTADDTLVGVGRALADGLDCAYIADVAVHPNHQRQGLGAAIIRRLVELAAGHKKIILYANPGTETFYTNLGFHQMNTAMAIWHNPQHAINSGLIAPT